MPDQSSAALSFAIENCTAKLCLQALDRLWGHREFDRNTFYGGDERGYPDYPFFERTK